MEHHEHETKTPEVQIAPATTLTMPIAIVIAGFLIAGEIFLGLRCNSSSVAGTAQQPQQVAQATGDLKQMKPIAGDDHIRGNPNAQVKIVEYSDMECPFCKRFHETLKQATAEYGDQIAWVYRHFPLDQLHSKARKEAVATECAAEQGGNTAFWKYMDRWFELTPSNNQTDIDTVLPQIAKEIGLDGTKFASCLASKKYDAHIEENVQNAIATGGNGTPWSIVVGKNGKQYPLSGAQPIEAVKQLIDLAKQGK